MVLDYQERKAVSEIKEYYSINQRELLSLSKYIIDKYKISKKTNIEELSQLDKDTIYSKFNTFQVLELNDDIVVEYEYISLNTQSIFPSNQQYICVYLAYSESDNELWYNDALSNGFGVWSIKRLHL